MKIRYIKKSWLKVFSVAFGFVFTIILMGCSLTSGNLDVNNQSSNAEYLERQLLTKTVYNATVSTLVNKEMYVDVQDIQYNREDDHNLDYDQIKVIQGYSFMAKLDFNLEPYFEKDYIDQEIEVIISLFHLHSPVYNGWYEQKMIIFKTDTEIVGFLSPQYGSVDYVNEVDMSALTFGSYMFLTQNEVVKYYEKGDMIYDFTVNLSNLDNIKIDIKGAKAFETDYQSMNATVNSETFTEITASEVLEIMELVKIKEETIEATITDLEVKYRILVTSENNAIDYFDYNESSKVYDLEENELLFEDLQIGDQILINIENEMLEVTITGFDIINLIYVSSEDLSSLETVAYIGYSKIFDKDGTVINYNDLKVGDVITFSYYKRYKNYLPTHMLVDEIHVDKIVEQQNDDTI